MRRNSLVLLIMAWFISFIQPAFSRYSLEDELDSYQSQKGGTSETDIDAFYNPHHFYELKSPPTQLELQAQKKCAQLLLKTLTHIPDKVKTFERSLDQLNARIQHAQPSQMVMHYLYVTAILHLNTAFEGNIAEPKHDTQARSMLNVLEGKLRAIGVWGEVMREVQEFDRSHQGWGNRLEDYDWLKKLGQLVSERLECEPILFHKETDAYGWGSNYYPSPFRAPAPDDVWLDHATNEHYFQDGKFNAHPQTFKTIRTAPSANDARTWAQKNFVAQVDPAWHLPCAMRHDFPFQPAQYNAQLSSLTGKDVRMARGLYYKFTQNDVLRAELLKTGYRTLVEDTSKASYYDPQWGNDLGENKQSKYRTRPKNMLGLFLGALRQHLIEWYEPLPDQPPVAGSSSLRPHPLTGPVAASAF